ncbi:MAG: TetR/AcrR family transcriptional regulator [Bradyrhizobium sp.]
MKSGRGRMVPPAGEKDGRRRRGARARAIILDRAMDVASVSGFEGLTVGSLASDLGISKGNITVLFGDKEALQVKTLDAAVEVFIANVVTPALVEPTPTRRLRRLCHGWFDYVDQRVFPGGCLMYAAINEYRARPGIIQDRASKYRDAWKALLARTIRDAQTAGEIRADQDIQQLVFKLTAFQASSNTAALLGDAAYFLLGRTMTEAAIREAEVADHSLAPARRKPSAKRKQS